MTTVVRSGGHRESLYLLILSLFFGFTPVAAYFTVPGTRLWAVAFGAILGLPLFAASLWRLGRCDVLRLSGDWQSFEVIRGSFLSKRGHRFPAGQVAAFHLEDDVLRITLKAGEVIRLAAADTPSLRAAVMELGIPFTTSPARSHSMSPADGTDAFD